MKRLIESFKNDPMGYICTGVLAALIGWAAVKAHGRMTAKEEAIQLSSLDWVCTKEEHVSTPVLTAAGNSRITAIVTRKHCARYERK